MLGHTSTVKSHAGHLLGATVQVYSNTERAWCNGHVADIEGPDIISVEYTNKGFFCRKSLRINSDMVRLSAVGQAAAKSLPESATKSLTKPEATDASGGSPCSLAAAAVDAPTPAGCRDAYTRQWVDANTVDANSRGATGTLLRVVQFNVLADGLSAKDKDKGGFTEVDPELLEWEHRRSRLIDEIFREGEEMPDIIGLQEVDHYDDWFHPQLRELGYDGVFLAKPNSPCQQSLEPSLVDGCALFWRREVATLVDVEKLCYRRQYFDGTYTFDNSNQVAILATLQVRGAGRVVVAVTHLLAAKDPKGERARAQQMDQLLNRLHAKGLPCIVAADMNGAPRQNPAADYPSEAYP